METLLLSEAETNAKAVVWCHTVNLRNVFKNMALSVVAVAILLTDYAFSSEPAPHIHIASGKYRTYYHIKFNLTKSNSRIKNRPNRLDHAEELEKVAKNGGQFEITIDKDSFPIGAPGCKGNIILRMPWTNPNLPFAEEKIKGKVDLYGKIIELYEKNDVTEVEVTIELNPYVNERSTSPLELELSGCNVFFRHANGGYINYVGDLR